MTNINILRQQLTAWSIDKWQESDFEETLHMLSSPVDFDMENCYFDWPYPDLQGFQETPGGVPYLCGYAGGDWQHPVIFVVYWNEAKDMPEMYIPVKGNVVDWENNEAYLAEADEDDEDEEYGRPAPEGVGFDPEAILADIIEFLDAQTLDASKLLERYGEIKIQIFDLQTEMREIEETLERHVTQNGPVAGGGFVAEYKMGRRRVNHEAAAKKSGVPEEIIKRHTKTSETVSWAKVTKEAGIPQVVLDMYTEVGDGRLEVKPIIS